MAIVKIDYTRSREAIKKTVRYNAHRPGKEKEKIHRINFGWDGELEKNQIYRMIDEAEKGTVFFRFKISPDPNRENKPKDLDLPDLTRKVILKLEELKQKQIQFIAVEHDDHTDIPHVHAIVLLKGKIFKQDTKVLIKEATQQALFQRRARDQVQHYQLNKNFQHSIARFSTSYRSIGMAGGKAWYTREPHMRLRMPRRFCSCGRGLSMKRLRSGQDKCFECGLKQERSAGLCL